MVKAISSGLTAALTSDNSLKITSRAMEPTNGATIVASSVNGRTIRWRGLALLLGKMVVVIMDPTSTTKKRVKVSLLGPMAASTMVDGSTESRMALALTQMLRAKQREANGPMGNELNG